MTITVQQRSNPVLMIGMLIVTAVEGDGSYAWFNTRRVLLVRPLPLLLYLYVLVAHLSAEYHRRTGRRTNRKPLKISQFFCSPQTFLGPSGAPDDDDVDCESPPDTQHAGYGD